MWHTHQKGCKTQYPITNKRLGLFYVFRIVTAAIYGVKISQSALHYITGYDINQFSSSDVTFYLKVKRKNRY
jgi:hypothetical protein